MRDEQLSDRTVALLVKKYAELAGFDGRRVLRSLAESRSCHRSSPCWCYGTNDHEADAAPQRSRVSEWIFLRELRVGTGFGGNAAQRLDAFALNCLSHTSMKRVCYEVKTSRADFLCELKQPLKRRIGLRYSNEFYFLTPAGLLNMSELLIECGLVEIGVFTDEERNSNLALSGMFAHFDPDNEMYCRVTVVLIGVTNVLLSEIEQEPTLESRCTLRTIAFGFGRMVRRLAAEPKRGLRCNRRFRTRGQTYAKRKYSFGWDHYGSPTGQASVPDPSACLRGCADYRRNR